MTAKVNINRAPVLTLWASVVAERLGYEPDTALTLGKVLAGLNAQSKGQRLGIFEPSDEKPAKADDGEKEPAKTVRLLGRKIPVQETDQGLRAEEKGKAVDPKGVDRYLEQKFKDHLAAVRQAMETLAQSMDAKTLESRAFDLYEEFRPVIPEGTRGWGAAGELDVDKIYKMADKQK
jgi:hypothetical protein